MCWYGNFHIVKIQYVINGRALYDNSTSWFFLSNIRNLRKQLSLRCSPNGTVFSLYSQEHKCCLEMLTASSQIKRRASDVLNIIEYHTVLYDCLSAFRLCLARPQFGKKQTNKYCVRCFIANIFIRCTTLVDLLYVFGIFISFYRYMLSQGEFNLPQQFSMNV